MPKMFALLVCNRRWIVRNTICIAYFFVRSFEKDSNATNIVKMIIIISCEKQFFAL